MRAAAFEVHDGINWRKRTRRQRVAAQKSTSTFAETYATLEWRHCARGDIKIT